MELGIKMKVAFSVLTEIDVEHLRNGMNCNKLIFDSSAEGFIAVYESYSKSKKRIELHVRGEGRSVVRIASKCKGRKQIIEFNKTNELINKDLTFLLESQLIVLFSYKKCSTCETWQDPKHISENQCDVCLRHSNGNA